VSSPPIADEHLAVSRTVRELVGSYHSKNIKMVRPKQSSPELPVVGTERLRAPSHTYVWTHVQTSV
jgi:hypothetical protein